VELPAHSMILTALAPQRIMAMPALLPPVLTAAGRSVLHRQQGHPSNVGAAHLPLGSGTTQGPAEGSDVGFQGLSYPEAILQVRPPERWSLSA
jgi:hypothetical protein